MQVIPFTQIKIHCSRRIGKLHGSALCFSERRPAAVHRQINGKSRQLCHRMFYRATELIYIDSGNGEFTGQVVCGVRRGGKTYYPPIGIVYPDVLVETDKFPTELSCAEASVSAPQSMAANITAATIVVDMVYNILATGSSTVRKVTFSTQTVNVRPELQKTSTRRKQAA